MQPYAALAFAASVAASVALAACVAPQTPLPPGGGIIPQSTCGADRVQAFIGQPLALLPPVSPDVTRRIIRPGDQITEDFSLQRLNVTLDAADRILSLTCG